MIASKISLEQAEKVSEDICDESYENGVDFLLQHLRYH